MHRSMQQPATMHLAPRFAPDHAVALVYYVEDLITHNSLGRAGCSPASLRANSANCSTLTVSARLSGSSPARENAASTCALGHFSLSSLAIIFRRWENACFTTSTKVDCAAP